MEKLEQELFVVMIGDGVESPTHMRRAFVNGGLVAVCEAFGFAPSIETVT